MSAKTKCPPAHGPDMIRVVLLGCSILTFITACRAEKAASVEELYTSRMLGIGYLQRNQLSEAEAEFRKLTELAPDDPAGYANLGLTYLQGGRYADAEKQLEKARELDPKNVEVSLALARVYSLTGRRADARTTLEKLRRDSTASARVLFALAEIEAQGPDAGSAHRYEERLREVLAVAPANIAARLKLLAALARRGESDSAVRHLEEVRRIPPELPREARVYLDSAIQLLRTGKIPESRGVLSRFYELTEVTASYQASLEEVKWPEGPIPGRAVLTFAPKDFISLRDGKEQAGSVVRFVDATSDAGLSSSGVSDGSPGRPSATRPASLAIGDVDGDGTADLLVSSWSPSVERSVAQLYRVRGGFVQDATERSGIVLPQGAASAVFADYDNDGWLDLFAIGGEGRGYLFRNKGDGTFESVTAKAGVANVRRAHKPLFVDLDHDGDLDLLLVGSAERTVYRNNLDGTFTEVTGSFGLGGAGDARDAVFGDFDGDGRIDVLVTHAKDSNALFLNRGAQRFTNATATSGLTGGASGAAAAGDYDNDGLVDLFIGSATRAMPGLWLNQGNGSFVRDKRSSAALQPLGAAPTTAASFVDYDNDGWLDLVVGLTSAADSRVIL